MKQRRLRKFRPLRTIALLPTFVTLGNTMCGFASILCTANRQYAYAAWLVLLGMAFDALDGYAARIAKKSSAFGANLDSLSDVLTFGAAPALLAHEVLTDYYAPLFDGRLLLLLAGLFVACAAIRLARFNVEVPTESDSHDKFAGLPSPGAAGTVATLVIFTGVVPGDPVPAASTSAPFEVPAGGFVAITPAWMAYLYPITLLIAGLLMVSRFPYLHFVNKYIHHPQKFRVLVEALAVTLLFAYFQEKAFFLGFSFYSLSGPARWAWNRITRKKLPEAVAGQPPLPEEADEPIF